MKEKKLNPNWDIVRKALGKEPQTIGVPKNTEPMERHDAPKPGIMTLPRSRDDRTENCTRDRIRSLPG